MKQSEKHFRRNQNDYTSVAASKLAFSALFAKGPFAKPCISSELIRKRHEVPIDTAGAWACLVQTLQLYLLREKKKQEEERH